MVWFSRCGGNLGPGPGLGAGAGAGAGATRGGIGGLDLDGVDDGSVERRGSRLTCNLLLFSEAC